MSEFDNFLTNKWFVIALIIALGVVIYMYSQKKCGVEGMRNVDLTPLSHQLSEKPWTDDSNNSRYKTVNNEFDQNADQESKRKFGNNQLKRQDLVYQNFSEYNEDDDETLDFVQRKQRKSSIDYDNYPKPLDTRPDLSQCQPCKPCVCPGDNYNKQK